MITGGKLGQILGRKRAFAIGCVIYGCGSFTTAIAPNLAVLIFGWSFLEGVGAALIMPAIVALVASNFGREQRPRGLRAGRLGGRHRRRRRPAHRRAVHDLPLVAAGVRRRGPGRARHPGADPAHGRHPARGRACGSTSSAPRCRRCGLGLVVYGVLRSGTWGFVQPKPEAPEWLGLSPVVWLILGGGVVVGLFLRWENHRFEQRTGGARRPGDAAEPHAPRRAHGVLLPVPAAGRPVLRRPAVPVGRPRSVGDRHRCPAAAAVDHAAARRRRHPQGVPERVAPPGRAARLRRALRRHRGDGRRAGRRRRRRDRHLADAARRPRRRRAGVAARSRDRVVGARRAERRGRRPAEHGHQPRRLDRHRARRRGAHLRPHHLVPRRHRGQPRRPRRPRRAGAGRALRRASRSCPTSTSRPRSTTPACHPETADAIVEENETARLDGLRASLAVLAVVALVALLFTRRIPTTQPTTATATQAESDLVSS